MKMGHVGLKTRSLGQILKKNFVCSRDRKSDFRSDTHETWSFLKIGYVGTKSWSLGKFLSCLSNVVVHDCYLHFALLFLFNCALKNQGCRCAIKHHLSIYLSI